MRLAHLLSLGRVRILDPVFFFHLLKNSFLRTIFTFLHTRLHGAAPRSVGPSDSLLKFYLFFFQVLNSIESHFRRGSGYKCVVLSVESKFLELSLTGKNEKEMYLALVWEQGFLPSDLACSDMGSSVGTVMRALAFHFPPMRLRFDSWTGRYRVVFK